MLKNRISAATERRREKKQPKKRPDLVERGESVCLYILAYICVTSPTSQVERSRLKTLAPSNTAHSNREKSKDKKMGLKTKREHC